MTNEISTTEKNMRFIEWQNGMIMCFDENGQQVPEYQGPIEEVKEKIPLELKKEFSERELRIWK